MLKFENIARQKGVLLSSSGTKALALADRDKIGQVLINLLHNALKFTPSGGTVSIETSMEDGRALLTVKDTGCGIAPEHLPFIFERFYRADPSRARETGGSGIGLAIAMAIARAHGGEIHVRSTVGQGSEFALSLPAFCEE
jgi:signal transduction histidine kinase